MFANRLSPTLSPSLYALNFKSAFTLSFSCKSPPEWISSHLLNQGLLSLLGPSFTSEIGPVTYSQTMNKHVSTQMFAAKQARNEETWECATRAGKGWAMKRAVRSSSDVWCGEGLARALFPRFRCVWWPAKFTFQQTGNLIFFLYFSASRALWLKRFSTVLAHSLKSLCLRGH